MSRLSGMLKLAAMPAHNPTAAQVIGRGLNKRWLQMRYPFIALLGAFGAAQLGQYMSESTLNRNFPERAQGVINGAAGASLN